VHDNGLHEFNNVVGYGFWKIISHVLLYVEQVKVFETTKANQMEHQIKGDDFGS